MDIREKIIIDTDIGDDADDDRIFLVIPLECHREDCRNQRRAHNADDVHPRTSPLGQIHCTVTARKWI